jgi:hypothetical protein
MHEQLDRFDVDPLLDIVTIRRCSIADRERWSTLPCVPATPNSRA